MTAYCETSDVAALVQVPLKGGDDFSEETKPTKSQVASQIVLISSQLETNFMMAGYKVPLVELEGESWPTHQTYYLKLLASMGTAAFSMGHARKPAPAMGNKQSSGNVFQDLYEAELGKIYDQRSGRSLLRFRAQYYEQTPAQRALEVVEVPVSDFMEGFFDPMRELCLYDLVNKLVAVEAAFKDQFCLNWDYMYSAYGINKGFGPREHNYQPYPSGY